MDLLHASFNHLVLPPRVPGEPDSDPDAVADDILTRLVRACDTVAPIVTSSSSEALGSLQASLKICRDLNNGRLDEPTMLEHFRELQPGQTLILHISEQNAALLMRIESREKDKVVIFESFETSPITEEVLAAKQALQWDFPGRSAQVPFDKFADEKFQESLASFLEKASMETIYNLQAQTKKAKVSVSEIRDTADPALISQMLMSLLEAMGTDYQAPVLRKSIRDDVNLGGSNVPWRRLPFWLVLRVAVQRHLSLALGSKTGRLVYKFLIASLLSELLEESTGIVTPDMTITLRAKLCRRMAKLELEKAEIDKALCHSDGEENCDNLFVKIGPRIKAKIESATAQVESAWSAYKKSIARRVPYLPQRVPDSALQLSLPNSGQYLDTLLSSSLAQQPGTASLQLPQPLDKAIRQVQDFTDHAFKLAARERDVRRDVSGRKDATQNHEARCIKIAGEIEQMFDEVGNTYDGNPEQMSAMILAIFTLWMRLDQSAIAACPLVQAHAPVFESKLLDVLQLPTMADLHRLQAIQTYIAHRRLNARLGSIFDQLDKNCLAVRYYSQSASLHSLTSRIQEASDEARLDKTREWERACEEYDMHTEGITNGTCRCTFTNGKREFRGCKKCWHWRSRKRISIQVQEAFLPEKDPAKACVVFELNMPNFLSAYRDATWRIVRTLAYPSPTVKSSKVEIKLNECEPLRRFWSSTRQSISLASTIKCFEQTHYKFSNGKTPLDRILLPMAARFELYDETAGLWINDLYKDLTLQHHCGVYIPRGLQATILPSTLHPPPSVDGPSSYELQANQTECPSDMSIHEFSTYQKLLAGTARRWPNILVELGSANLNFSNEDTSRVLSGLVLQAGPELSGNILRVCHAVFEEPSFLKRLAEAIQLRLGAIAANWREHNCMELLITLIMRLLCLSSTSSCESRAVAMLITARQATLDWTIHIQQEVQTAKDADAAQRATTFGLFAAILCRRTFAFHAEIDQPIGHDDLRCWIQASIALQQNLLVDISTLNPTLRSMLLRDAKMSYHLEPLLREAVGSFNTAIGEGIANSWSGTVGTNHARAFSPWRFLAAPNDRWVVATTSNLKSMYSRSQPVHVNLLEGHVLVDGRPRGKLPLEIRDAVEVKHLFGNQHILTYSSSMPDMLYRLANDMNQQEVHFGLRDGRVVIRTYTGSYLLEFVPMGLFCGGTDTNSFDLPTELIHSCTHWLNLTTKRLEIRRAPNVWKTRERDWTIDVKGRRAQRGYVHLVDPQSSTFADIARIFENFERPERLTVSQTRGSMQVELRHFELTFFVNPHGFLECRQLKAVIDHNQDAGTWYGLQSKLVLRDAKTQKRSIIVPLGKHSFKRNGMHVSVRINEAQEYGRYYIDDILGRLLCAPEPRLMYMKAVCHAFTSFCLPDTLTGRTGREEAVSILRSGAAQPWVPLAELVHPLLDFMRMLAPQREYYPPKIKRLQTVAWHDNLTTSIQHDDYEAMIHDIMLRSNQLSKFASVPSKEFEVKERSHLSRRGEAQRKVYERPLADTAYEASERRVYVPRDRKASQRAARVYEIARLILSRCSDIYMRSTLESIFESWPMLGGFLGEGVSIPSNAPLINQIEDPLAEQFGELIDGCRHAKSQPAVLFRLGLLAFEPGHNIDAIRSLAGFATIDGLKSLSPPDHGCFNDFKNRGSPTVQLLETLIATTYPDFKPKHSRGVRLDRNAAGRDSSEHSSVCGEEGRRLAQHLKEQWPVSPNELSVSGVVTNLVNTIDALQAVKPEWTRVWQNEQLAHYTRKCDAVLTSHKGLQDLSKPREWQNTQPSLGGVFNARLIPSVSVDLMVKAAPCPDVNPSGSPSASKLAPKHAPREGMEITSTQKLSSEYVELKAILSRFARTSSGLRQQYGGDLLQSLDALAAADAMSQNGPPVVTPTLNSVTSDLIQARKAMKQRLEDVTMSIAANDSRFKWLDLAAIWPSTTPFEVLRFVATKFSHEFGKGMKEAILSYGLAVTDVQRLERLRCALLVHDSRAIAEELRNPGHENWEPVQYPDWLLLEIDSNIIIRAEQIDVARAIITPSSGNNSVLQMNMGKGKTSCIVPMVMAILADGKNLARLIVPKALLMQTAQTTQSRLGGLVGREVRHVPFSRKTQTESDMLGLYQNLHHGMHVARGVMLTSHEHILSYKLGGWQHLSDGKLETAKSMTSFQKWLNQHCRDVLDECDFTLSVKTQLNYPGGVEMPVDGHPVRWEAAQGLLALASHHIHAIRRDFRSGIEIQTRQGSFPVVQFLRTEAEDALHARIVGDICAGRASFLRLARSISGNKKKAIQNILSEPAFDERTFKQALSAFVNPKVACKTLLVVRGLLINRILILCLSKRWNVQYGLDPRRHPVAVPFEAKGIPSEQSEFGHPDVAILFTCLAFYYTGLTMEQVRQSLQNVLQSDDPASQYERWTSGCTKLPEALTHWNVINIDDSGQLELLWRLLQFDRVVIDHYLNIFVFPPHAKQFEAKLQASGWDIPLFAADEQRGARTTGFSGTNDNRSMLPLTIQQADLPSLRHTSAEVLSYLLQQRNRGYQVTVGTEGRFSEERLLQKLHEQGIRVLIDAGAYVLEMDNKTLVRKWMEIDGRAPAAVYFGDDNRAWVYFRGEVKKNDVPLLATSFADNLDECLVYLDEAHTRGVDLKLPLNARGALTLALKQTKDFTVQAAMRLRQLRTTQSVVFFAPPEVDQSIRHFCRPRPGEIIDSSHVISWLLEQTCRTNEDLQPLYVAQGLDFCRRTDATWRYVNNFLENKSSRKKLLEVLRQPERQTLERLYGGEASSKVARDPTTQLSEPQIHAFVEKLNQIGGARNTLQVGAMEEVEQEREVQVQVEQVRQVQRPLRPVALVFPGLHPTIQQFIKIGLLDEIALEARGDTRVGFEHAFEYIAQTALGKKFGVQKTESRLFVSKEFGRTIAIGKKGDAVADDFLRPVEWVLWSPSTMTALVVIPEEAELIIPILRQTGERSPTQLIAYAAPVTRAMNHFNTLQYYNLPDLPNVCSLPQLLRFELGVLAGRLYVDSAEWEPLGSYLQPTPVPKEDGSNAQNVVGLDNNSEAKRVAINFADDPAAFLLEWLTLRRKTQDVMHTPVGHICTGRIVEEGHPLRQGRVSPE